MTMYIDLTSSITWTLGGEKDIPCYYKDEFPW